MSIDLKNMTAKELEKLMADVQKALHAVKARDRRAARKAAEKAAAEFGYSLDELADENAKPRRKAKKAAVKSKPKFANPDDKKATWTGKGRQPNWYRAAIEKGMSPEELAI